MIPTVAIVPADNVGEIAFAVATVVAVVSILATLHAMLKRTDRRNRLTPALVIVTAGAGVTLVAYLAFLLRCSSPACRVRSHAMAIALFPSWYHRHAWQWGTQLALASVGLLLGSLALALAARQWRGARLALSAAGALYALWAALVFALPNL